MTLTDEPCVPPLDTPPKAAPSQSMSSESSPLLTPPPPLPPHTENLEAISFYLCKENRAKLSTHSTQYGSSTMFSPGGSQTDNPSVGIHPCFNLRILPWLQHYRLRLGAMLYFASAFASLSFLFLLFFTPDLAQRSFEKGAQVNFQQASILDVSNNDAGVDTITMRIVGEVSLHRTVYSLSQKLTWLLGDIDTEEAVLEIFHTETATSTPASMGTLRLPGVALARNSQTTHFDFVTPFTVGNPEAVLSFCQDAVASKTVSWRLSGKIRMNLGWMFPQAKLIVDKQIALQGMDGLKQVEMQNVAFTGPHRLGGLALQGQVGIYNPSKTFSMQLGSVNFGIYLPNARGKDVMLALVQATNASLVGQKINWFQVSGRTLPIDRDDEQARRLMDDFLAGYVHGETNTVHVRGSLLGPEDESQPAHSVDTPDWLQKTLASLTLQVPFPGARQTGNLESLAFNDLHIDFSRCGDPLLSGDAVAIIQTPEEMRFFPNMTAITPRVFLYHDPQAPEPFAKLASQHPCRSVSFDMEGERRVKLVSRLDRVPLTAMPRQEDVFHKTLSKLLDGQDSQFYLRGTAAANVNSVFGHLTVRHLTFQGSIKTSGKPSPSLFYSLSHL